MVPNKVYDALACGRPIVTADSDGAREWLRDGETALLTPAGDAAALAAALRRLLDERERARLGEGGARPLPAGVHACGRGRRAARRSGAGVTAAGATTASASGGRAAGSDGRDAGRRGAAAVLAPAPHHPAPRAGGDRGGDGVLPRRLPGPLLGQHRELRLDVQRRLARRLGRRLPALLLRAGVVLVAAPARVRRHQPVLAGRVGVGQVDPRALRARQRLHVRRTRVDEPRPRVSPSSA